MAFELKKQAFRQSSEVD